MHINSMPDLLLRRVFTKLSLRDLYKVGRVCRLWKWHQMSIGKQVRSLTLLIGSSSAHSLITNSCFTLKNRDLLLNEDSSKMNSSQYLHKRFHLNYSSFSMGSAAELSKIFPRITTLEIAFKVVDTQIEMLNPVVALLGKWSPVLKTLKTYFQLKEDLNYCDPNYRLNDENEFFHLLNRINSLPLVEHLTLECHFALSSYFKEPPRSAFQLFGGPDSIDLPILAQLREFYLKTYDPINVIDDSLKRFAVPNENLKQIGLKCFSSLEKLRLLYPKLAKKIVCYP